MLASSQIFGLETEILRIYGEIETDLVSSLARKLAQKTHLAPYDWRLEKLSQMGSVMGSLESRMKRITKGFLPDIETAVYKAMETADRADLAILKSGERAVFEKMTKAAIANAKMGLNLSNSRALEAGMQSWYGAVNTAYVKTLTGSKSLEQSVAEAVRAMARDGMTVTYISDAGRVTRTSLEVAVRRAVTTSVTQAATQMTMERCEEHDIDLVQVTEHDGARPEHALWQGKVYSLTGRTEGYELLEVATGYGEVDGLGGVNCRHTFYPYFEGTKAEKDIGDTKAAYELTQEQRYIERNIRRYKRQEKACLAAGDKVGAERARDTVSGWQGRMRSFIDESGLTRQYPREQIYS